MNQANKNADKLINELQLYYNKARQAAITQEMNEIVASSGRKAREVSALIRISEWLTLSVIVA